MKIVNRKAGFNYVIGERIEAGVVLTGAEVKSLYLGQAILEEAYVKLIGGEVFLVNAHIHPYKFADVRNIDPKRTRKLLLNRKELLAVDSKMKAKNLVLIPIAWYTKGPKIKLEIALAKGKKNWEKKEAEKLRDIDREAEEAVRGK